MDLKQRRIFEKAQDSRSNHQKCVIMLTEIYKNTPRAGFLSTFLELLYAAMCHKIENLAYIKNALSFVSLFCAEVTKKEEKENKTHDFLIAVTEQTLKWSCLDLYDLRHNSCWFLARLFQDIGEEIQLEINLINEIQRVLLERMQEAKVAIRLVAMSALVRLQDPHMFECPVISSFSEALLSGNAQIRKEAVAHIAPNMGTLSKIKDRTRDVDHTVRAAAFRKCADIGPLSFRIIDRHIILLCGFKETNENVKTSFFEYLLPKWLTVYGGNYLKFVGALNLLADEEDINRMGRLCRDLIKEFLTKNSVDDLIKDLPNFNDEKLIDIENLNNTVTIFWNILTSLLRELEMDDSLNQILPELTPFCHYIEKVVTASATDKMDEWKYFEYQFDLLNLFEMAENFDFSDEVGRRTMQDLTTKLLQNYSFISKLTKKLVSIAHKCSSNIDFFTNDMCQLISEIREPLIDNPLSEDQRRERDFQYAELRVKINVCEERKAEAIQARNYLEAQQQEKELLKLDKQLESFTSQTSNEKVRVTKSDDETLCRCLDILIGVLELPAVDKLTPSLITCRDNFLVPLISVQRVEPHWRILRCLALLSIIDKATAEEYAKILCIPIVTYRTIPINSVSALVTSICAITDLIVVYGVEIVSQGTETVNTSDSNGKRRLYSNDVEEDPTNLENMTLSYIVEIFLDMLDDEQEEIRRKAVLAISILVKRSLTMTSPLLSRILLKWYNPLTAKQDDHLQVYLGLLINEYMQQKNAGEVMKEAMIPTLNTIARAPRNSPLIDIEIDNVLMFFYEMMNVVLRKDDLRILALDLCMKISEKPTDRIVPILTKLLLHLDIPQIHSALMDELIERVEMLSEIISDKNLKRQVEKFVTKLKPQVTLTNVTGDTTTRTTETENTTARSEKSGKNVLQEVNENRKTQQVKRRKKKSNKVCVVQIEKLNLENLTLKGANDTTLHTIPEVSMQMEIDEDLTIENVTSESSNKSARSNVVISETSDSSFSNDNEGKPRRSRRCRKKRIV